VNEHGIKVLVQPSHRRVYKDAEYSDAGAIVTSDLSDASVILGVKQVPSEDILPERTYMFFSHTIKAQKENMALLNTVLDSNVRLMDYECITDGGKKDGQRLVAFGKFAGTAGMINILRGLGEQLLARGFSSSFLSAPSAYMSPDLDTARESVRRVGDAIRKQGIPRELGPLVFVFTGNGKVSGGAQEIFDLLPHRMVKARDLAAVCESFKGKETFEVIGVIAEEEDLVTPLDGRTTFERKEYYEHPERFQSVFYDTIAPYTTCLINCVYWDQRYPRLLTCGQIKELDAKGKEAGGHMKLMAIADISCDVGGSVEFLTKVTDIEKPFFAYNPQTMKTTDDVDENCILMMGVDILPSELPKEASTHFGDALMPLLPELAASDANLAYPQQDLPLPLQAACITNNGELTPPYKYIEGIRKERERLEKAFESEQGERSGEPAHSCSLMLTGHLFDTGLINQVFDLAEGRGCNFEMMHCDVRPNTDNERHASSVLFRLMSDDADTLNQTKGKIMSLASLIDQAAASITEMPNYPDPFASGTTQTDPPAMTFMTSPSSSASSRVSVTDAADKKKVLLLGAGLVSMPCLEYLSKSLDVGEVTVASHSEEELKRVSQRGLPGTRCVAEDFISNDGEKLGPMIIDADVVISLLPAPLHPIVANKCLDHNTNFVSTSYISPELQAMNAAAEAKGLLFVNEVGLDPGMDHMSAKRFIDHAQADGGVIKTFSSVCGGIPSPEAANNPLAYKFSWSPRGVLTAAKNASKWMEGGKLISVPGEDLLKSDIPFSARCWPAFNLEVLPNRDAIPYGSLYGLEGADTVFRGTLRYRGWSHIMYGMRELGMFDMDNQVGQGELSWKTAMDRILPSGGVSLEERALAGLEDQGIPNAAKVVDCMKWLGCFSDDELYESEHPSTMDSFCALLQKRLAFGETERDLVLMHHDFGVERRGSLEQWSSSLLVFGEQDSGGSSAMAKTVGMTCGIATEVVLTQNLASRGVMAPVVAELYDPILDRLSENGLTFTEERLN
jgi:alpha-aminoadipic semialdehyde synthase